MTTVSIVIPCYNEITTIEQVIDGVLESQVPGKEIIVIDDASTSDEDKLGAIGDMNLGMSSAPEDDWVVAAADNLLETDLSAQLALFEEHGDAVITVRRLEGTIPPKTYGEVHISEEGVVTGFIEKPEVPSSDLVSIGLYLYPRKIVARIREYLDSGGNPDAPGFFAAWLSEQSSDPIRCLTLVNFVNLAFSAV